MVNQQHLCKTIYMVIMKWNARTQSIWKDGKNLFYKQGEYKSFLKWLEHYVGGVFQTR